MRIRGAWWGSVLLVLTSCSTSIAGAPVGAPDGAGDNSATGGAEVGLPPDTEAGGAAPDLDRWRPSATDPDPSLRIEGIYVGQSTPGEGGGPISYPDYPALHILPDQRVAYDRYPPVGGPHDSVWATCDGVEYSEPVRNENMVHALEHGAIWVAYNPDTVAADAREKLASRLTDYVMMSPYPGLTSPISLQFWAHQLQVDTADDLRIDQFFAALYRNQWVYPETGALCVEASGFDTVDPPPFVAEPPGDDAVQLDGS